VPPKFVVYLVSRKRPGIIECIALDGTIKLFFRRSFAAICLLIIALAIGEETSAPRKPATREQQSSWYGQVTRCVCWLRYQSRILFRRRKKTSPSRGHDSSYYSGLLLRRGHTASQRVQECDMGVDWFWQSSVHFPASLVAAHVKSLELY